MTDPWVPVKKKEQAFSVSVNDHVSTDPICCAMGHLGINPYFDIYNRGVHHDVKDKESFLSRLRHHADTDNDEDGCYALIKISLYEREIQALDKGKHKLVEWLNDLPLAMFWYGKNPNSGNNLSIWIIDLTKL